MYIIMPIPFDLLRIGTLIWTIIWKKSGNREALISQLFPILMTLFQLCPITKGISHLFT